MRASRLGDDIDDFCVKCKRVMNHAVVSLLNDGPAKVRCRTCHSDHDFRREQPPPPKVDPRKAALFNQVLANVADAGSAELSQAGSAPAVVPVDGTPIPAAAVPPVAAVPPLAAVSEEAVPAPTAKSKGRKKAQA